MLKQWEWRHHQQVLRPMHCLTVYQSLQLKLTLLQELSYHHLVLRQALKLMHFLTIY
jgi:hypothetical protein